MRAVPTAPLLLPGPLYWVGARWPKDRMGRGGEVQNIIGLLIGLIVIIVLIDIIANLW